MPVIKWTKGDEELNGPDDLPIGHSVLVLTNVQETAEYTCYAMSDLGESEHTVTVTVRSEYRIHVHALGNAAHRRYMYMWYYFMDGTRKLYL